MLFRPTLFAAALACALPTYVSAQPVTPADLREHIEVLASDAYEGRGPGTAGEAKTLAYISGQLSARGFEPAATNGSWFQPVPLVERKPGSHVAQWKAGRRPLKLKEQELVLVGRGPAERVDNARVVFAGHALPGELAKLDLKDAVAVARYDASKIEGAPTWAERSRALVEGGAAAVIAIMPAEAPWPAVLQSYQSPQTRLQSHPSPRIQGAMSEREAARLTGQKDLRASFEVSSQVRNYVSHNLVGRLRGSGATGESVMYLGHWDHLGICRPEGEADRICNGAVDNASGIAMMIEIGERLARGKRPQRDILIMATTAEEMGLLGARHFAAEPTVKRESIVAAMNLDTVAIHGRGEKLAVIGRGIAPLDAAIEATARALGRAMDEDKEADPFVVRQDGWELTKAGIPTVMVGGSFSNMVSLNAFLSGPYHKPGDDMGRELVLEGAAEDADFMLALGRRLADPALYPSPR
jgi:Zn-dependent M28 family amino/carboxypeptidase